MEMSKPQRVNFLTAGLTKVAGLKLTGGSAAAVRLAEMATRSESYQFFLHQSRHELIPYTRRACETADHSRFDFPNLGAFPNRLQQFFRLPEATKRDSPALSLAFSRR